MKFQTGTALQWKYDNNTVQGRICVLGKKKPKYILVDELKVTFTGRLYAESQAQKFK